MTGYSPVSDDDGISNTSQSIVWIIAASVSVITLSQLFHLLRENSVVDVLVIGGVDFNNKSRNTSEGTLAPLLPTLTPTDRRYAYSEIRTK